MHDLLTRIARIAAEAVPLLQREYNLSRDSAEQACMVIYLDQTRRSQGMEPASAPALIQRIRRSPHDLRCVAAYIQADRQARRLGEAQRLLACASAPTEASQETAAQVPTLPTAPPETPPAAQPEEPVVILVARPAPPARRPVVQPLKGQKGGILPAGGALGDGIDRTLARRAANGHGMPASHRIGGYGVPVK